MARPTTTEMLLVINDIHSLALAARLKGGDDGSLMLDIEELAEGVLEQSCCAENADTDFVVEDDEKPPPIIPDVLTQR